MKRTIYLSRNLLVAILSLFSFFTFTASAEDKAETPPSTSRTHDEIALRRNISTRSAILFSVKAYLSETTVDVLVENYVGQVLIIIEGSSVCETAEINGDGCVSVDITPLSEGETYVLRIIIDGKEYRGSFTVNGEQ